MSDEYKARMLERIDLRKDQMLAAFDQQVLNVSGEFFTMCAPILTDDLNHGILFASNE